MDGRQQNDAVWTECQQGLPPDTGVGQQGKGQAQTEILANLDPGVQQKGNPASRAGQNTLPFPDPHPVLLLSAEEKALGLAGQRGHAVV